MSTNHYRLEYAARRADGSIFTTGIGRLHPTERAARDWARGYGGCGTQNDPAGAFWYQVRRVVVTGAQWADTEDVRRLG